METTRLYGDNVTIGSFPKLGVFLGGNFYIEGYINIWGFILIGVRLFREITIFLLSSFL